MKTTIDDLLVEGKSDSEVCDGVFDRLGEAGNAAGATLAHEEEKVVFLTWHARGVIGNGGFSYFFHGGFDGLDPDYVQTVAAFETLKVEGAVRAFHEALAWFPGSRAPRDPLGRRKIVAAVPKDEETRVSRLFFDSEELHTKQLANYIRAKKDEIEAILTDLAERAKEPIAVDATWDIGSQRPVEVTLEFIKKMAALPPGSVLALVTTFEGERTNLPGDHGEIELETAREVRVLCGMTGNRLVRATPPTYLIRREEDMQRVVETNLRIAAEQNARKASRSGGLLPAFRAPSGKDLVVLALVALVVFRAVQTYRRATRETTASVRCLGPEPAGLRFELTATRERPLEEIDLARDLALALHAHPPAGFEAERETVPPQPFVRWRTRDPIPIGSTPRQLVIPCEAHGTERGEIRFVVRGVAEAPRVLLGEPSPSPAPGAR